MERTVQYILLKQWISQEQRANLQIGQQPGGTVAENFAPKRLAVLSVENWAKRNRGDQ